MSSEAFTERVLQAREESTAEADRVSFQKACDACHKTYFSENAFRNHLSSAKHKAKEAQLSRNGSRPVDDASSVMSSTFSLGEPMARRNSVDSDAKAEFDQVVESIKKTHIDDNHVQNRPSPVKRPSNPHLSAAAQHKSVHPVSTPSSDSTTPVPSQITPDNRVVSGKTCLFCSYDSPTLDLNVNHMERIHSMFIPERQYLVDLPGLIGFLQQIVYERYQCISCGKLKGDPFAIQTHMRDAEHCKIPYFTEIEQLRIGDFYDFRSTYSDEETEDEDGDEKMEYSTPPRLGVKRTTMVVDENGEALVEDEGWETDSSASSVDTDEITSLPMDQHIHQYEKLNKHLHHSLSDPRRHKQTDGYHSHAHKHAHHAAFYDDYELHLPSGKSVGHRSLARYYKQNLKNHPLPEEREAMLALEAAKAEEAENAMDIDRDEANQAFENTGASELVPRGERGMTGVAAYKKKEVQKEETRSQVIGDRKSRKVTALINKRSNNQKHYYYREG